MGITRRYIFPTVRILLWAVIAVALVKMAFTGADITPAADPLRPTAEIVEPHVAASAGTITNTVTVKAAVVADAGTSVRATLAGTVTKLLAKDGQQVDAGTAILVITLETPVDPTVTTNAETGVQTVTENKPKITTATIKAPHAGTLTLPTLKDQVVSVGDVVATVSPGTMSVSGTLTPDQQYRLLGAPADAKVSLKGGPAPFTCTNLRIGAAAPTTGTTDSTQVADTGTSTAQPASGVVTCAIPAGVIAFPGLGADMAITNGTAENAVVVPVTSVQGSVQNGNVWVVQPDGTSVSKAVTLGLTDGETVQIVEGLALGDEILQFIPVGEGGVPDCNDPASFDPVKCAG
ncbi:secretion protein HlyD [Cellulomonas sp. WB94]|uniref:efflux RND transporter periplasmic adaptor subunit n=1 Tax=Cellulomonas sp. WB94 TaxID=2173174 RepID=UPI000D565153|nr:biotin/lipoyl-binding protein [Cellulomonas sp. WB94]PVU82299.1 secretion protein HlyD [Cellulomonas sp. WB94]